MTYEDIEKCVEDAKKFDKCNKCYIRDNFTRLMLFEENEEFSRNLAPYIYKQYIKFFCRCGYYSSNPYDFNFVKNEDYQNDRKRKVILEREVFM